MVAQRAHLSIQTTLAACTHKPRQQSARTRVVTTPSLLCRVPHTPTNYHTRAHCYSSTKSHRHQGPSTPLCGWKVCLVQNSHIDTHSTNTDTTPKRYPDTHPTLVRTQDVETKTGTRGAEGLRGRHCESNVTSQHPLHLHNPPAA